MKRIVILISGRGSNMQALVEAHLPCEIAAVISNDARAGGLAFAQRAGITTRVVEHRQFAARDAFDAALAECIDAYAPDLVVLAGFMRILGTAFVERYAGRLINIHPALLPAFTGVHTHRRALEEGVRVHGCTVHFVTPELDHGPIIVQAAVPVLSGDDEASLAARVLRQEHRVFALAVRWFLEDRLSMEGQRVVLRGEEHPLSIQSAAIVSPEAT